MKGVASMSTRSDVKLTGVAVEVLAQIHHLGQHPGAVTRFPSKP